MSSHNKMRNTLLPYVIYKWSQTYFHSIVCIAWSKNTFNIWNGDFKIGGVFFLGGGYKIQSGWDIEMRDWCSIGLDAGVMTIKWFGHPATVSSSRWLSLRWLTNKKIEMRDKQLMYMYLPYNKKQREAKNVRMCNQRKHFKETRERDEWNIFQKYLRVRLFCITNCAAITAFGQKIAAWLQAEKTQSDFVLTKRRLKEKHF